VIDAQIRNEIDMEDESFQSLKASIRDWNVMAPIILMRMEKDYRLIAGERRLRACRELGLPTIPAREFTGIHPKDSEGPGSTPGGS
jgi:ParB/RepB/Spo0J family partition protein